MANIYPGKPRKDGLICEMCGATPGKPHQDNGRSVTLHFCTCLDGVKRTVCMLCRDGIKAVKAHAKRKAPAITPDRLRQLAPDSTLTVAPEGYANKGVDHA